MTTRYYIEVTACPNPGFFVREESVAGAKEFLYRVEPERQRAPSFTLAAAVDLVARIRSQYGITCRIVSHRGDVVDPYVQNAPVEPAPTNWVAPVVLPDRHTLS